MAKSFAQILEERIGRSAAPRAVFTPGTPAPEATVWQICFARQTVVPRAINQIYRAPSRSAPGPKNSTVPPVAEPYFALQALPEPASRALAELVSLGATELNDGFSPSTLRRAHRRLAKRLHPDLSPATADGFRRLRQAYLILVRINLSGGSESASEPAYPRPNAA